MSESHTPDMPDDFTIAPEAELTPARTDMTVQEMREWLRVVLSGWNFPIDEATSGAELVRSLVERGPYNLVIADVRMSWTTMERNFVFMLLSRASSWLLSWRFAERRSSSLLR